jgi:hypothetical protein
MAAAVWLPCTAESQLCTREYLCCMEISSRRSDVKPAACASKQQQLRRPQNPCKGGPDRWAYKDPAPPPGTYPAAQAATGGSVETAGGSADAAGSGAQLSESEASDRTRDFTKRRWATDSSGYGSGSGSDDGRSDAGGDGSGGGVDSSRSAPQPKRPRASTSGSSSGGSVDNGSQEGVDDVEQRRLRRLAQASDSGDGGADEDKEPADAWATRTPPLQVLVNTVSATPW